MQGLATRDCHSDSFTAGSYLHACLSTSNRSGCSCSNLLQSRLLLHGLHRLRLVLLQLLLRLQLLLWLRLWLLL